LRHGAGRRRAVARRRPGANARPTRSRARENVRRGRIPTSVRRRRVARGLPWASATRWMPSVVWERRSRWRGRG